MSIGTPAHIETCEPTSAVGAALLQRTVGRHMRERNWSAAALACSRLNRDYPRYATGWHSASLVALALERVAEALHCIERALTLEPRNARYLLQRAHCLVALGRLMEARSTATAAYQVAPADAPLLDAIGTALSRGDDQQAACGAYDRALALAPDNARFLYNRATVHRYLGALAEAEADYDRVIALDANDYEAYRNRADLRPQSPADNHVAQLQALLMRGSLPWQGEVQLQYALAKELEDLGRYEESFRHLARGARLRRQHLRYDVATDVASVDWIIEAFPAPQPRANSTASAEAPIFIVGLPRSGTTVVDRILSSHPVVRSAGELPSFALAVMAAVTRRGASGQVSRRILIERAATLDCSALGRDYLTRARAAGADSGRFTDKMPLNYLYCGLIARALPNARIVHVSRHPIASCHAIHKTLFKDGYPFAYDLDELARYYIGYRRLMAHWQQALPGRLYTLEYEKLVADQFGESRRLLEFCGLDWHEACAHFEDNSSPVTSASAAQVRRSLYRTSVSQWQNYRSQLSTLALQLQDAGVCLGDGVIAAAGAI